MIIVLTGPTGVGKTDTGWALVELAPPMVLLDCDWFAARVPFSWKSDSDVESVYQAISVMLDHHTGRGVARFVIPFTLEMAASYARNGHHLVRFNLPLHHFRLSGSAELLHARVLQRDRNSAQRSWELDVIPSQLKVSEALPSMFMPVDVNGLDEHAVARKVLGMIAGPPQRTQAEVPQAARR